MPAVNVVIDKVVPLKDPKKRVEFRIGEAKWVFTMWRQDGCNTPVMETYCVGLLTKGEEEALVRALKKHPKF
jgi:hypothetical protein